MGQLMHQGIIIERQDVDQCKIWITEKLKSDLTLTVYGIQSFAAWNLPTINRAVQELEGESAIRVSEDRRQIFYHNEDQSGAILLNGELLDTLDMVDSLEAKLCLFPNLPGEAKDALIKLRDLLRDQYQPVE